MHLRSCITATIPILIVIVCLRIYSVQAYVSYVPSSRDTSDETYDVTEPQQPDEEFDESESEDDILFRLLNKIIAKGLHRSQLRDLEDMYEENNGVYRPSKRAGMNYQKRKVFWQPLGYLPPGVSMPGRQNAHPAGGSRSQVFRYGK